MKPPITDQRDMLRFSTMGSVDDGKSTLIGRLLYDAKRIFQDQLDALKRVARLRGEEDVNLALLTDGLRAEREQGITIDVAYRYFSTPKRRFIIADTPGHEQYTRNMATGASTADLALILIDARAGMTAQTRRHLIIAGLLGIPRAVVCVNKMDLVGWDRGRYEDIAGEYRDFARKLTIRDIKFIPVSALRGDNVAIPSPNMPWYEGQSLLKYLENVTVGADRNLVDFRFPVQYVIRTNRDFRGYSGRIASGTIRTGEEVLVLPGRRQSRIKGIHLYQESLKEAFEGQSVVLTLEDEIDISRGDMIVRARNIPEVSEDIDAALVWMDELLPLVPGKDYLLRHTTRTVKARVEDILYRLDVNTLHRAAADTLALNEIGRVRISCANPLFFDPYERNRATGGFVIIDPHDFRTLGAGMVRYSGRETLEALKRMKRLGKPVSADIHSDPGFVGPEERSKRNGHPPFVLWFTGLSGAGKSTIAKELEKRLWEEGRSVVRLDGDNLRFGLNADLGFGRIDRGENIRRAGHAARLLYDFGHIVLCTFVSPYREDRNAVRGLFPEGDFSEVYVRVSLEEAKRRDPKGLYAKADAGELKGLTGVDAPFEEPERPDLFFDTEQIDPDAVVLELMKYLKGKISGP